MNREATMPVLFALQADWYSQDVLVVPLLEALKIAARPNFDKLNPWFRILLPIYQKVS